MLHLRRPTRTRGMTRQQAELAASAALALGWDTAQPEPITRTRWKLVLIRKEGDGSIRNCAWTWADWVAFCREETRHELPF